MFFFVCAEPYNKLSHHVSNKMWLLLECSMFYWERIKSTFISCWIQQTSSISVMQKLRKPRNGNPIHHIDDNMDWTKLRARRKYALVGRYRHHWPHSYPFRCSPVTIPLKNIKLFRPRNLLKRIGAGWSSHVIWIHVSFIIILWCLDNYHNNIYCNEIHNKIFIRIHSKAAFSHFICHCIRIYDDRHLCARAEYLKLEGERKKCVW